MADAVVPDARAQTPEARLDLEFGEGYLLTDEHHDMLAAIKAKDVERADKLAHDHTRQFRDSFIAFMKANYATDIALGQTYAAQ